MAVYSIGQLANKVERRAHRTYAPVRRGSIEKGTFEHGWYRAPQRYQYGLMCDGVRLVDEHLKRQSPGAPAGPLGLIADKLMRAMHDAIDGLSGRLDVSLAWLCQRTGFSKPTVLKGLKALEEHGFLDRQRRCERTELAADESGPRWKQATNAYRLKLPELARRLLGLRGKDAPIPDDERERRAAQSTAAKAMLDALPANEIGTAVTTDKELAAALNRLGQRFVSECESTVLPQSLPSNLISSVDKKSQ